MTLALINARMSTKTQVLGYRNVVLDKKERLRLILNGGFGRENPAKKLSLIQICDFWSYCWWFRNPKTTTWVGAKNLEKSWDQLPTSTGEFTGFLNHQAYVPLIFNAGIQVSQLAEQVEVPVAPHFRGPLLGECGVVRRWK